MSNKLWRQYGGTSANIMDMNREFPLNPRLWRIGSRHNLIDIGGGRSMA
jgi:hypothetical protein